MSAKTPASRTVTVTHHPGLHARPCLAIVNTVRRFQSKVEIRNGREVADAGEVLQLMSMGVDAGTDVTLTATGPDANEAIDALVELFQTNFGFSD